MYKHPFTRNSTPINNFLLILFFCSNNMIYTLGPGSRREIKGKGGNVVVSILWNSINIEFIISLRVDIHGKIVRPVARAIFCDRNNQGRRGFQWCNSGRSRNWPHVSMAYDVFKHVSGNENVLSIFFRSRMGLNHDRQSGDECDESHHYIMSPGIIPAPTNLEWSPCSLRSLSNFLRWDIGHSELGSIARRASFTRFYCRILDTAT